MKMKLLWGAGIGLALCIMGCSNADDTKPQVISLSKSIEYDVAISNAKRVREYTVERASRWFSNNIEGSTRIPYLEMLLAKVESGCMKITDMEGKPIDSSKIKDLFYAYDTLSFSRPYAPYEEYDTVLVVKTITALDIMALRFKEDWTYDPATMAISKKIIAVAPVVMPITVDPETGLEVIGEGKPAFWISFEENSRPTYTLTNRIMYSVNFKHLRTSDVKNADSAAIDTYLETLFQQLYSDSMSCYEVGKRDMADSLILPKELKRRVEKDIEASSVLATIRFIEEWTFDYTTLAISKKVVGVCPVYRKYNEAGEFRGFKLLCWVYFGDVWMPYDKKLVLK
jgi:hypothetical protein